MTLFNTITDDQLLLEMIAYEKHIRSQYDHTINIDPMPTPRPRSRVMTTRAGQPCAPYVLVYQEPTYVKYMDNIQKLLKDAKLGLKPGNYSQLFVTFYIPYPPSTPQKKRVEGAEHKKKPDYDNYIKGFQDAMEKAGLLIGGDGQLSTGAVKKRYTTQPNGRISFNLI